MEFKKIATQIIIQKATATVKVFIIYIYITRESMPDDSAWHINVNLTFNTKIGRKTDTTDNKQKLSLDQRPQNYWEALSLEYLT